MLSIRLSIVFCLVLNSCLFSQNDTREGEEAVEFYDVGFISNLLDSLSENYNINQSDRKSVV